MPGPKRFSNHKNIVTLFPGDFHVGPPGEEILLHTLLGSCIAACLYDPVADPFAGQRLGGEHGRIIYFSSQSFSRLLKNSLRSPWTGDQNQGRVFKCLIL